MRIAIWNIRGFGAHNKKSMIKCLIKEDYLDLVGLVETKHAELSQWDIGKCWGHQGSQHMHITAVEGSSGIIVSWHQDSFTLINCIANQRWICVIGEFTRSQFKCAICVMYAPNGQSERLQVWNQIQSLHSVIEEPMVLMGDFNEVLSLHERRGATELSQGMRDFQDLVLDLQLIDMEIGQSFTWMWQNAASRIDQIMVQEELLRKFPDTKAFCKGRSFSDHYPIILVTTQIQWGPTPFRSLDVWLNEPSFLRIGVGNGRVGSGYGRPVNKTDRVGS